MTNPEEEIQRKIEEIESIESTRYKDKLWMKGSDIGKYARMKKSETIFSLDIEF